ncbi:hypothetical protein WR25_08661 isoform A [Diploscapter pachys]|uniref:Uncharacterized protein n=2 Tax=Diploscapter pachys TaxID=2018661 RepID=A0A2A2LNS5_9BILA|nr:hypothetical protein WR25_08661 isoform A [Diploscapter pachys]
MFAISSDRVLRDSLAGVLRLSPDCVFSSYRPLPAPGSIVVGINEVTDANLRFSIRYCLANAEKSVQLIVVKRDWTQEEIERLDEAVRTEYHRANANNAATVDRISNLPDCEWKRERLQQLSDWKTIPTINHTALTLDDDLKSKVDKLVSSVPLAITEDGDSSSYTTKPPVLHWTADPLEGEVQLVLRLSFGLSGPDEPMFRQICRSLKPLAESTYEWIGGILLTSEPTRIHVQRFSDTIIEISSRICVDELEGSDCEYPMRLVWPYLAAALKAMVNGLREHSHMQYTISIIPFGSHFINPEMESRVFDLVVLASTALRYNKVAFRHDNKIYSVNLNRLFPDGVHSSLSGLLSLQPPSPKASRPDSVIENSPLVSEPATPGGLSVAHNRGRRVSFGTIKLMTDGASPAANSDGANGASTNGVDEYVDTMLKVTMNELVHS